MSEPPTRCFLCERPLGRRIEWHHPVPKSKGGRDRVPVHPICHRTIHRHFTNAELARIGADAVAIRSDSEIEKFVAWLANKPPDFHAATRGRRKR
ncbi:MAG: HNH endonuclease [Parasphingopyxis sp.]|uniref:HNH endonuclease n=1 Tax=Parasphingopyxis sp. TaxID=1920299 RepID=UPI003FA14852